jgi:5-formyltetrahydrofolate cyclo-ligase
VTSDVRAAKAALRRRLRAARAERSPQVRAAAGLALQAAAAVVFELAGPALTVAAYAAVDNEPPTDELLEGLRRRGVRVLLPVLAENRRLDWADYAGPASLARSARGLREPTGPRLGVPALQDANVVLVPALAVDRRGTRLGQGGGYYDRALVQLPRTALVLAVVYDEEVVDVLPDEPHDVSVAGALTPGGAIRFA